jgi:AcrR family transcriptional regulator
MARHFVKGEIRRRQIAEASLTLIAERGLGGFTMRSVAERLPITDGTIFRHFRNKHEIVSAAMDLLEEELFTLPGLDDEDPLRRLEAFFKARAQLLGGPRAIGRLVFSEELAQAAGEGGFERVAEWRRRSSEIVARALAELSAGGRLREDVATPQLVRIVLGCLLSFSHERLLGLDGSGLDGRIDLAWSTLETLLLSA